MLEKVKDADLMAGWISYKVELKNYFVVEKTASDRIYWGKKVSI